MKRRRRRRRRRSLSVGSRPEQSFRRIIRFFFFFFYRYRRRYYCCRRRGGPSPYYCARVLTPTAATGVPPHYTRPFGRVRRKRKTKIRNYLIGSGLVLYPRRLSDARVRSVSAHGSSRDIYFWTRVSSDARLCRITRRQNGNDVDGKWYGLHNITMPYATRRLCGNSTFRRLLMRSSRRSRDHATPENRYQSSSTAW